MELLTKYIKYLSVLLLYVAVCVITLPKVSAQEDNIYNLENDPLTVKYADSKSFSAIPGRLTYTVSSLNQENITVGWHNSFTKKTKVKWFARLQYRLSESDNWKDVKDSKGRNVEFVTSQKRYSRSFDKIVLPAECNNKDFVQISWLIDTYGKNKSGYPDIHFNNITVYSEYDEFQGVPAQIAVYDNSDADKKNLGEINFNKIPLPYIYPESRRVAVEGKNIRDSITIRIIGNDAANFSVSQSSVEAGTAKRIISVAYNPKKEGRHEARLIFNTTKLPQAKEIILTGSCAKHTDYSENLLPENNDNGKQFSYTVPVFSNTDYQYRITQSKDNFQRIKIRYRWYRDDKLLFSMYDTVKKYEYCAALKSPVAATSLDIELSADRDIVMKDYYFGSPKVKTMIHSGLWTDADNWQSSAVPNTEDFVVISKGVNAKVDDDISCSMLILDDSANVSINTGKTFYVSNDIFYNKNAWFTVHQSLMPSRWNYISSPVNQAHAAIFSMKNFSSDNDTWFMQYNTGKRSKLDDYWSDYITDPQFPLTPGRGYAVYTHNPVDVKYEGLLCSKNVTVPLVFTKEDRWNLVGNPYTAPLSSKKLFDDIDGKIQGNVIMMFDRETKVYNPLIIDNKEEVMIPSLESFFVEALYNSSEITFKRSHQYIPKTVTPAWTNENYLKLSVTKGKSWQYVLLGMEDGSSYGFDEYDCHKMFGNNEDMPDIYLKYGYDEYSVNVLPDYPAVYDIGLYIGNPSDVEINLNNLSIMPDYVRIFIEDTEQHTFYNMCKDGGIKTYLQAGTSEKYRLHILQSVAEKNKNFAIEDLCVWKDNGRLLMYYDGVNAIDKVEILNYKDNKLTTADNITNGEVFYKDLKKGKYKISVVMKGKKAESFDFEM